MLSFWISVFRLIKAVVRAWETPEFRASFALTCILLLSGTLFYRSTEGWSWVDALFFSAMTIATIGTSELSPQTDLGKIFTIIYSFVGVGVLMAFFIFLARAMLTHKSDDTR